MQEAQKLSVNLVTWNSLPYLANFFAALGAQDFREFTVTVIDNASTDGTAKWLEAEHPEVTVFRNFKNQGVARAKNQALTLALSRWPEEEYARRYILTVNPDIELAPDCLGKLVSQLEEDAGLDSCGPKLFRAYTKAEEDGARESERTNILDSTGSFIARSRRVVERGAGQEDDGRYDGKPEVFGVNGTCVVYRAAALMAAKLDGEFFDEDFFMYYEDADLAWRMRRFGMRAAFVPQAHAWHNRASAELRGRGRFRSRRAYGTQSKAVYLQARNALWLWLKNDEGLNRLAHLPWIAGSCITQGLAALFSWSRLTGFFGACGGAWKIWRKRRMFGSRIKLRGAELRRWLV
ncbi:MAG: glycosyltransferase family 2 protein [Patescibacteria group bacterium]